MLDIAPASSFYKPLLYIYIYILVHICSRKSTPLESELFFLSLFFHLVPYCCVTRAPSLTTTVMKVMAFVINYTTKFTFCICCMDLVRILHYTISYELRSFQCSCFLVIFPHVICLLCLSHNIFSCKLDPIFAFWLPVLPCLIFSHQLCCFFPITNLLVKQVCSC